MKRVWMIAAVCLLLALLCACGAPAEPAAQEDAAAPESPAEPEVPAQSETPAEPEPPAEPEEVEAPSEPEEPAEPNAPEVSEAPEGPTAQDALAFVDQDVSAMVAAIGEPISTSYEASCMGDGDDGIWEYDGFIVFTYREKDGSAETVIDAE